MKMLEIIALPNGAHRNQTFHGTLPDGWAVIPDDMDLPNFPFGKAVAKPDSEGVMTVTTWEPLPIPEPAPEPIPAPSQLDRIEDQMTYTAMMTNTLLGV